MKAEFTKFNNQSVTVCGKIDKYNFEAKLFDESLNSGIENGRVSKLLMWDEFRSCIVDYERGWIIAPSEEHEIYLDAIMELLENSPLRFQN